MVNGALLGAPVRYGVTQLVPALAPGEGYSTLSMVDTLDAKLTPSTGKGVTVEAGSTSLVAEVDYQAVWAGQRLTVTLTPAGLAKLRAGQHVVFGFEAAANAFQPAASPAAAAPPASKDDEIATLKAQLASLTEKIERLGV